MSNGKPAHGLFCWNELMTRDPKKAGTFYQELLGWKPTASDMTDTPYMLMKMGDKDAGGMMAMPPQIPAEVPSHWMSYITVDDVDKATKKVTELGGQVLHGPQDVPGVGRFVTIQDPTGAVVSLIQFPG